MRNLRLCVLAMLISVLACSEKDNMTAPTAISASPMLAADRAELADIGSASLAGPRARQWTRLNTLGALATSTENKRIELGEYEGEMPEIRLLAATNGAPIARLREASGQGQVVLSYAFGGAFTTIEPGDVQLQYSGHTISLTARSGDSHIVIDGEKVLGPRLAAVGDATSPEDAVVKFNLLLARLRQHGLIEPGGTALAGTR